jgi:hypothetical protein
MVMLNQILDILLLICSLDMIVLNSIWVVGWLRIVVFVECFRRYGWTVVPLLCGQEQFENSALSWIFFVLINDRV